MSDKKQGILHHLWSSIPSIFLISLIIGFASLVIASILLNPFAVFVILLVMLFFFLMVMNRHRKISPAEYVIEAMAAVVATVIIAAIGHWFVIGKLPAWGTTGIMFFLALFAAELASIGILHYGLKLKK